MTPTRRALLLVTFGLATAVATADDLTTNGGKKISGKLVSVDAQGVTFSTGDAQVKVSGKDIVLLDLNNKIQIVPKDKETGKDLRVTEIEFTDGSTFRASKFALKGKKVEAELFPGPNGVAAPTFEIPMTTLFSVMRGAEDPKNRESWKKMLASRGKRDLYVIRDETTLNFVQGTVLSGSDDGKDVNFEKEDGTAVKLFQSRASGGFVFAQPQPAQVPQTLCKVLDVFGNTMLAQAVEISPSGVTVTTVSGVIIKYQSSAALSKFDYGLGNVAYISDLDPQINAPETPADEKGLRLNVASAFIKDQGLSGEPLKLGTDTYPKGLLIAPDTVLTFNINGDYRDFKAIIGIPEITPDANLEAKVTIEADGRVLFSEPIKRKDKPKGVSLDVKGVKQLRVIVEADFGVNGNRVLFGDARVQK